ncbi:RNA polymerase sigma factor [Cohnella suwonensis]|uniref:RNA polymerase sigma factor n=1 Tax=Cohnella suwonensis TaxID=696072 RepID=A0ABW0LRJ4_9BACL
MSDEHLKFVTAIEEFDIRSIMERYGEDVWNYAFFLTRRRDWADDISQDVFVKAYRGIDSFRGQSSLKTWLLRITRNTAFSYRKLAFFRRTVGLEFGRSKDARPSAENEYIAKSYADDIWSCVMRLPDKYRETLVLSAHYGMQAEEIARHLGVAIGTVKSRLHRARARLADMMGRKSQDDDE